MSKIRPFRLLACLALIAFACAPLRAQGRDESEDLVVDPYCQMKLAKKEMPFSFVFQGETYHFCMEACMNEFRGDPKKFTGAMGKSREVNGLQASFLSKPTKPTAGQSARLILEFEAVAGGGKDAAQEVEVKLDYSVTVGGSTKKFTDQKKLKAYTEPGVFGCDIKCPGKGYCDATFAMTFASGKKQSETFKFEILPGQEEDTGNEYDAAKFDMIVQHQSKRKVGIYWTEMHEALWGENADFERAGKALAKIQGYAKLSTKFNPHKHTKQRTEFGELAKGWTDQFAGFQAGLDAKDAARSRKSFLDMDAHHCTKCHLKFRWDVVQDLSRYPDLSKQPSEDE